MGQCHMVGSTTGLTWMIVNTEPIDSAHTTSYIWITHQCIIESVSSATIYGLCDVHHVTSDLPQ
uniref:Uncharacterized protein n=1 Tax=Talaromyces marneffei PM1 TaxID=1077442 RepID=A0A093V2P5_TALMA